MASPRVTADHRIYRANHRVAQAGERLGRDFRYAKAWTRVPLSLHEGSAFPILIVSRLVNATSVAYSEECIMNKDQVKGVAQKMRGKVNEAMGKVTGRPSRELKGDVQHAAGEARKDVGDAKEAAKGRTTRHH